MNSPKARLPLGASNRLRNIEEFLAQAARVTLSKNTKTIETQIVREKEEASLSLRLFLNPRHCIVALTLSGDSVILKTELLKNLGPLGWKIAGGTRLVLYRLLKPANSVQLASQILVLLNALKLDTDSLRQSAFPWAVEN